MSGNRSLAEPHHEVRELPNRKRPAPHEHDTPQRLAGALDGHAVIGFEFNLEQPLQPDLVRL